MTDSRFDEGQYQQHAHGTDREPLRGVHLGMVLALDVNPHDQQHEQRHGNVNEHHEGKEAASENFRIQEIPGNRLTEDAQGIEPLGGGDGDVLGQYVPDHPVAADATGIDEPQQGDPGEPGKPACTTVAVHCEFT